VIAIPLRQIDAKLQVLLAAGVGQLAQHIAMALTPGAARDGVRRERRGPEAKAIVVLCRDDDPAKAGSLEDARPLSRIERGGIEDRGALATRAPLDVRERVRAEVNERVRLHPLPGHLRSGR
jgi:hypothetical protein